MVVGRCRLAWSPIVTHERLQESREDRRRRFPTAESDPMEWFGRIRQANIANMNAPVKFLLLLDDAPRAFLFDGQRQFLGEVIEDDGFVVDSLLRSASTCHSPVDDMLSLVVPPPSPQQPMRCFELD